MGFPSLTRDEVIQSLIGLVANKQKGGGAYQTARDRDGKTELDYSIERRKK
ncbi:hypothetical protein ACFLWO_00855 [Chloroflexota bacterium]